MSAVARREKRALHLKIDAIEAAESFASALKMVVKAKRLDSTEAAEEAGLDKTSFFDWENGKHPPTFKNWLKLVKWCGYLIYAPFPGGWSTRSEVRAEDYRSIAVGIRRERLKAGLTREQLAAMIGFAANTILNVETGSSFCERFRGNIVKVLPSTSKLFDEFEPDDGAEGEGVDEVGEDVDDLKDVEGTPIDMVAAAETMDADMSAVAAFQLEPATPPSPLPAPPATALDPVIRDADQVLDETLSTLREARAKLAAAAAEVKKAEALLEGAKAKHAATKSEAEAALVKLKAVLA